MDLLRSLQTLVHPCRCKERSRSNASARKRRSQAASTSGTKTARHSKENLLQSGIIKLYIVAEAPARMEICNSPYAGTGRRGTPKPSRPPDLLGAAFTTLGVLRALAVRPLSFCVTGAYKKSRPGIPPNSSSHFALDTSTHDRIQTAHILDGLDGLRAQRLQHLPAIRFCQFQRLFGIVQDFIHRVIFLPA